MYLDVLAGPVAFCLCLAALVFAGTDHLKIAWWCAFFGSPALTAFTIICARNPQILIDAFGYELADFGLLLMLIASFIVFAICLFFPLRWLLRRLHSLAKA